MGIFRAIILPTRKRDRRGEREEKEGEEEGVERGERKGKGWEAGRNTRLVSFLEKWTSSS